MTEALLFRLAALPLIQTGPTGRPSAWRRAVQRLEDEAVRVFSIGGGEEQPSNAVAEASNWSDVMGKVIEFYLGGPVAKKVKPIPIEQRGKLVEFPKERFAVQSKTEDNTERGEVILYSLLFVGSFLGRHKNDYQK